MMNNNISKKTVNHAFLRTEKMRKITEKKATSISMYVVPIYEVISNLDEPPNNSGEPIKYFTIPDEDTSIIRLNVNPFDADVDIKFSYELGPDGQKSPCFELSDDGVIKGIFTGHYDYVIATDLITGLKDKKKIFVPVKKEVKPDVPLYVVIDDVTYPPTDNQFLLSIWNLFDEYYAYKDNNSPIYKIQILNIVRGKMDKDIKAGDVSLQLSYYKDSPDKLEFKIKSESPKNKIKKVRVKISYIYNDLIFDDFWLVSEKKGSKRNWHIERNTNTVSNP